MTKEIIESVKGMLATTEDSKCLSKSLIGGMKSKNYVSVMKRQKCGKNSSRVIFSERVKMFLFQTVWRIKSNISLKENVLKLSQTNYDFFCLLKGIKLFRNWRFYPH